MNTTPKILLISAVLVSVADAVSIVEYTNRREFEQNSVDLVLQDFDSYRPRGSFNNSPQIIGDVELSTSPLFPVFSDSWNTVLVVSERSSGWSINGTNFVSVAVDERKTFKMQFSQPVYSFGADFAGWNDGSSRSQLNILGNGFRAPVTTGSAPTRFFGYISDEPFTEFTITGSLESEGLFFDDVVYSFSPVPEPTNIVLLVMGLFVPMFHRSKQRARMSS